MRAVEAHRQNAGDMKRGTAGAVRDLVPAGGAVGDDERRRIGAPHRRQQRQLGHLRSRHHRSRRRSRTRRPCRSSSTRSFRPCRSGDQAQHLFHRLEGAERFLVAMAVNDGLVGDRSERQLQSSGLGLADQKFLEQQRMRADGFRGVVGPQRQQFVAQRQKAARLETDDRHAARGKRRIGRDQTIEFGPCLIDQPRRQERAAAAERAAAVGRLRQMHAIAACNQHAQRRRRDFRAHRRD